MTTTPQTSWPDQISLPGQTHAAPGPLDMTNMYVAHHAFRRDLERFESAVRQTPIGERDCWTELAARWHTFGTVLHHHHTIEDTMVWPVVTVRTEASGDAAGSAVLAAMEAEHELIDPALAACTAAFATMVEHPCNDHRNALDVQVTTARQLLLDHMRHEETEAIPLLQRVMTVEEWAAAEAWADKHLSIRLMPFLVPWAFDDVPQVLADEALAADRALRLMLRLFRRGYEKRTRTAFRHQ